MHHIKHVVEQLEVGLYLCSLGGFVSSKVIILCAHKLAVSVHDIGR